MSASTSAESDPRPCVPKEAGRVAVHDAPLPIAVLVSGRGSHLAALIAARDAGHLAVEIVLVASDRISAEALHLARAAHIPTLALPCKGYPNRLAYDLDLLDRVATSGAKLLVLAGFMHIIDGAALVSWVGRIINIHPSLLPRYRGLHTHQRVLQAGDREHGASVHFVTAELDGGPLIAQARLPVRRDDNETTLAARLLPLEHRLLHAVVKRMVAQQLALTHHGVMFNGALLKRPLRLRGDQLIPSISLRSTARSV